MYLAAPQWCDECQVFHYNGLNHVCLTYDGPECSRTDCTEPTYYWSVGAPGVGSGRTCKAGHREEIIPSRIMTPGEVR